MGILTVYLGLFLSAFAAATLFPMQSEAALVGLLLTDSHAVWALVAAASFGNVAGSFVNWVLGRSIERFRDKRWFPVSEKALQRAQRWYRRYGRWSLLLSWMPIIGDPLTLAAGIMKEPLSVFLVLVTIAKTGRYLALTAATMNLM
ncbi:DedA family protein [Nitratireductor aquimarinus]|nr:MULTISPECIES: YqaA family protein [Nitratireductor]MBY6021750.1 DedA family protein [Nitratireductor sp. DP7N14-4]MBN7756659.1 DedA family protein [Nitratireductor aquimarinus]MBN7761840.1 DedA family protein [Nitratireductor aquibiodomus]MBN7775105.1 DedA family protein [Nitratireductor pacificus]MBN7781119.1 DedA family protein [Nitratireductor pacificus]